ncbi:MAG TPA: hypothetical protein VFA32_13750, partial [Dehalococcoidia bacterium]|nr:hypothetical protein [Dehalococcoidia bacterium]
CGAGLRNAALSPPKGDLPLYLWGPTRGAFSRIAPVQQDQSADQNHNEIAGRRAVDEAGVGGEEGLDAGATQDAEQDQRSLFFS